MWCVWYVFHMPGVAITTEKSLPLLVGVLLLVCAAGARLANAQNRGPAWLIGTGAGLVAGLVDLLLLGSKVVEQPQTTADLADQANRFNPDAPWIVLGFLGACMLAGGVAGLIGGLVKPRYSPTLNWRAGFSVVAAFTLIPLVIAGGLVTSTESGMAVPDSVTTYGSLSFLFPLSLMSQPRIFFEHTHRLFGTFVGVTAIVQAVWFILGDRAWRSAGMVALVIASAIVPFALELAGVFPLGLTIAWLAIVAIGSLGAMVTCILFSRLAAAAGLLLALVIAQGLLGALRVSEISTPLAYAHGVLAQLVFASAAALAATAVASSRDEHGSLPERTEAALRVSSVVGPWSIAAAATQLVLGAGFRHTSAGLLLYSHAGFAVVVATLALVLAIALCGADAGSQPGRRARRFGLLLFGAVTTQVVLGITAFVLVLTGTSRPIPTYQQLAEAGTLPAFEAAFTTAHQALGAVLLALIVAAVVAARHRLRSVQ